ncbi:MAG: hypothetical protein QXT34_03110 [Candidatus Aenigmatarchaeota archaeon]
MKQKIKNIDIIMTSIFKSVFTFRNGKLYVKYFSKVISSLLNGYRNLTFPLNKSNTICKSVIIGRIRIFWFLIFRFITLNINKSEKIKKTECVKILWELKKKSKSGKIENKNTSNRKIILFFNSLIDKSSGKEQAKEIIRCVIISGIFKG